MDRLLFSLSFLGPEIVRETGVCVCVGGGVSGGRTGVTSQPDVEHEVQVET